MPRLKYNRGMDYFIADTHFGHSNILKHCHRLAFMTPAERDVMENGDRNAIANLKISWETTNRMDRAFLDNINSVVGKNDRLIHLGDFCWVRGASNTILEAFTKYRKQIKCRNVVLVWGNHDPKQFSSGRFAIESARIFSTTSDVLSLSISGRKYFLSHYAHAIWDCRHHGARHLYGHSHGASEFWLESIMPNRFAMDVGIDNAYPILGEYRPFQLMKLKILWS